MPDGRADTRGRVARAQTGFTGGDTDEGHNHSHRPGGARSRRGRRRFRRDHRPQGRALGQPRRAVPHRADRVRPHREGAQQRQGRGPDLPEQPARQREGDDRGTAARNARYHRPVQRRRDQLRAPAGHLRPAVPLPRPRAHVQGHGRAGRRGAQRIHAGQGISVARLLRGGHSPHHDAHQAHRVLCGSAGTEDPHHGRAGSRGLLQRLRRQRHAARVQRALRRAAVRRGRRRRGREHLLQLQEVLRGRAALGADRVDRARRRPDHVREALPVVARGPGRRARGR